MLLGPLLARLGRVETSLPWRLPHWEKGGSAYPGAYQVGAGQVEDNRIRAEAPPAGLLGAEIHLPLSECGEPQKVFRRRLGPGETVLAGAARIPISGSLAAPASTVSPLAPAAAIKIFCGSHTRIGQMNFRTQKPRRWSFRRIRLSSILTTAPSSVSPRICRSHRPLPNAAARQCTGFHPPQARQQRT